MVVQSIRKVLERILLIITSISLGILVIATFAQVVGRYVFNNSPSWTEELSRFSFIWCTMTAIPVALSRGLHASVTLLIDKLKGAVKTIFYVINSLITIASGGVIVFSSYYVTKVTWLHVSPAMHFPMPVVQVSIFVCGIGLILFAVLNMIDEFSKKTRDVILEGETL